jgi:hypothetical protein
VSGRKRPVRFAFLRNASIDGIILLPSFSTMHFNNEVGLVKPVQGKEQMYAFSMLLEGSRKKLYGGAFCRVFAPTHTPDGEFKPYSSPLISSRRAAGPQFK